MKVMTRVKVKIFNEEGKWLLNEIKGLKEGTILEGNISPYNKKCFEFKWNDLDACLWLNSNCYKMKKKTHRIPKGYILDTICYCLIGGKSFFGETKKELISQMEEEGYSRNDYEIYWESKLYNLNRDYFDYDVIGEGETREESIKNFRREYFG